MRLVLAELKKIKRHYLLSFSMIIVLFSALLAMFQLVAASGTVRGYLPLTDGIIWNNTTLAFPFLITFFGGFLINREFIDGTLKSNLIIPISFPKLKLTKIIVTGLATVMFCFVSLVCSFVFSIILHYPMNMGDISIAAKKILITGMCCYIAVIPIILLFTAKRNSFLAGALVAFVYGFCGIFVADTGLTSWYPTTTGLTIISYNPDLLSYHLPVAIVVLTVCVGLSLLICFKKKEVLI